MLSFMQTTLDKVCGFRGGLQANIKARLLCCIFVLQYQTGIFVSYKYDFIKSRSKLFGTVYSIINTIYFHLKSSHHPKIEQALQNLNIHITYTNVIPVIHLINLEMKMYLFDGLLAQGFLVQIFVKNDDSSEIFVQC